MIYVIGGSPRCGKSRLAKRFSKKIDGQVLSGDALTHAMQDVFVKPEWVPDLFEHIVDPLVLQTSSELKIQRLRRRDLAMWRFYEGYFEAASRSSSDDILIEGGIWPDSLAGLKLAHRAVFLVDTSPNQAKRLIKIRDSDTENNWMKHHSYDNAKIIKWAEFNVARSRLCVEKCQAHGYVYFDIANHGIEQAEQLAFEYLLAKAV